MEEKWISVFSAAKIYNAELVKQTLLDNKIDAVIVNEKDSAFVVIGEIEVHVREADQENALEIIKEFKS